MTATAVSGYTSGCQITRVVSEQWGAENLYCAACPSSSVQQAPPNTKAIDYRCPRCDAGYQLKAGRRWSERRIPDAGHSAMIAAIRSDEIPNLLVLQYDLDWQVRNPMLIPSFMFHERAIEKRKPLAATARRAGWVGCNILLSAFPDSGRIRIIDAGNVANPRLVRDRYQSLRPLSVVAPKVRGWTLDVLRVAQALKSKEFTLAQMYAHEAELQAQHPENRNVRAKIRQQLQVLRDLGILAFQEKGRYCLIG